MKVITTNLLNRFWKNGVLPIKTALAGKLDTAKVINNLLTTAAGYALDARQGKILNDKITELNSNSVQIVKQRLTTTGGMIMYSNGLLEQWGRANVPGGSSGSGTVRVTLEESYLSNQFEVKTQAMYPNTTYPTFEVSAQPQTANGFNLYTRQSNGAVISGVTVQWETKGIWK